ncbi:MAG: H-NS histone family protein [Cupriavidus sp.]|nr:MAG: H-NS histone family protein [Cupriavidus sp.]
MSAPDVTNLSYAELLSLSKQLDREIEAKRSEELKVLADGYIKKMEAAGFSVVEAIDALKPYLPSSTPAKQRAASSAPVLYQDPANPGNTWSGRGRAARWLVAYEAQGRSREEFLVKH